ncbi:prepilin-type N-terminal cleavage/methylation domain-containing protein [bacterium]|nr:prepilin-type N-terminal cleavage/methylation domain-containing protein [bacterium]
MRRRRNRGFTLVEVMAAVVVMGIGISAVMILLAKSTAAINLSRGVTMQTSLARLAMVEVENKYWRKQKDKVETSGDFGPDFPEYTFEVVISEGIDERTPALDQVDVIVYWQRSRAVREYRLTTFLIDFSK